MIFSHGERLVIIGALQWAAMEHDKLAKHHAAKFDRAEAARFAAFSAECARIADKLRKAASN